MTLSMRQQREQKIAQIEAALVRPRFLWLRPRVLIHDHAPSGAGPCPCCGSRYAAIVEERPQLEVVVDCVSGRRVYAADVSPATWSKVTAAAERHDVPLRLSRTQAALVFDESAPFKIASGGNRAAKTTAGLVFMALEWLRRGGPQRRFWLIASTVPKCYRLLEKLFLGTGESPPILPRALVRTMPATHRASDLRTILADGSVFDLKPFAGDPGAERAKSDAIVAALVDEAAHLPTVDWVTALRGRCLDAGGWLWFASTPRPGHFLRDIVDDAHAFRRLPADDPARVSGKHEGARWLAHAFPIPSNPWLDQAAVAAELASLDENDPSVRRDVFGEWNTSGGVLWRFDQERHVVLHEGRTIAAMLGELRRRAGGELIDVTDRVVAGLTARPNPHHRAVQATNRRYLVASDFNVHPMSSVVLQVAGDPRAPGDKDRWHVVVHDSPQSAHSNALLHAERLVDPAWVRTWDPKATASPFLHALMICDPTALGRDPTAHKHGRDPGGLAATLARATFDARAPSYRLGEGGAMKPVHLPRYDSHLLVHRLLAEGRIHVSARCVALIESLLNQEDSGDGVVPFVKSHTKSDELAGPVDALRYALHAIFHGGSTPAGRPAPGHLPAPRSAA